MAKRDPAKTLRNQQIAKLTDEINELLDDVLELTGYENEHSLNATYGGKYAEYIDIKNEVIDTPEQFVALYLQGFCELWKDWASTRGLAIATTTLMCMSGSTRRFSSGSSSS